MLDQNKKFRITQLNQKDIECQKIRTEYVLEEKVKFWRWTWWRSVKEERGDIEGTYYVVPKFGSVEAAEKYLNFMCKKIDTFKPIKEIESSC